MNNWPRLKNSSISKLAAKRVMFIYAVNMEYTGRSYTNINSSKEVQAGTLTIQSLLPLSGTHLLRLSFLVGS